MALILWKYPQVKLEPCTLIILFTQIQIWTIKISKKKTLNKTIKKFGYPEYLIKDYEFWILLLRPEQITVGSMVIIHKHEIFNFSSLENRAHGELLQVYTDVESIAYSVLKAEKVNFLTLMIVDKYFIPTQYPDFRKT